VSLNWQHEFLQNPYDISSSVGGQTFNTWSAAPLRDTLYTGVGVTMEYKKKWNASLFYNAAAGNKSMESQNIFLSLGTKF
jgi:outer membrane autotransporter protein